MNGILDYCVAAFMSDHPDIVIYLQDDRVLMYPLNGNKTVKRTILETKKEVINDILNSMYKELKC